MPWFGRDEYSEVGDYDLEWNLKESYSSRSLPPLRGSRRRLFKEFLGNLYHEDDRGRYRNSRPRGPPGPEIVIAPKDPKPAEFKHKCCPCHTEKLAAAQRCHTVHVTACCGAKPAEKKPEEECFLVDVEDWTDGPMTRRHWAIFPVSISPKATIDDIISKLTPDRHRHKVLVEWDDGYCGDLETVTKVADLKHYARGPIITKRKQVRYGRVSTY